MMNRRRLGTSGLRVRVLPAGLGVLGLVLLAAGFVILGGRVSHTSANLAAVQSSASGQPSPLSKLSASSPGAQATAKLRALSYFSGLPLMFEPNQGQANLDPSDRRVRFLAHASGYGLYFGHDGAILTLPTQVSPAEASSAAGSVARNRKPSRPRVVLLEMKLAGANPDASLTAADPLPGKTNYLLGNDPAKWRRGIPEFARLRYENIYPGINLVFYGNQGHLEYDFQVAPGADPGQAELEFHGAKRLELRDGVLVIQSAGSSSVRFNVPRVYQEIAGRQQPVEGKFVLRGDNRAGFALGPYDHSRELVIDPVLSFSTLFGGTGDEHATSVAVDSSGLVYLAGSTTSPDLLTLHPGAAAGKFPDLNTTPGAQNVYITRIDPNAPQGPVIDYITYLGGSGIDSPVGIAVNAGQQPMVAGTTTSIDFPHSTNPYQLVPELGSKGLHHVFVTRLDDVAGTLLYSSYLSGNGDDIASGMTLDNSEHVYVTGTTTSTDTSTNSDQFPASSIPTALSSAFQAFNVGASPNPLQFFVTVVDTGGFGPSSINYSTYFGGGITSSNAPVVATGGGIAVDLNQNIYFDGTTNYVFTGSSTVDFPIKNSYQPCLDQPPPTVIINPPTCTNSGTLPDAFVAKLVSPFTEQFEGGAQLLWSTYLGGTQTDSATGIAVDSGAANVYVVGTTNSQQFTIPATIAPYQACLNNLPPTTGGTLPTCTMQTDPAPSDAYVARFNNPSATTASPTFNVALTYFSYLGGSTAGGGTGNDSGAAVTVDTAADAIVTGFTESKDFPIFPSPNDGIQNSLNGARDAFLARINTAAQTGQNNNSSFATYFGGSGTDEGTSITLDANQNVYFAGDTNSPDFQVANNLGIQHNINGGFDAFVTKFGTAATLGLAGQLQLGTNQTFISAGNPATFIYTLTNNGPDPANNITVTDNVNASITGVSVTPTTAGATPNGTCSGVGSSSTVVTCTIPQLQSGSQATITITMTPAATASGNSAAFNGGVVTASAANGIGSNQVTVTAQMSDFTVSASPNSFTVPEAGDTATYQVELTPHPVFGNSISLNATGAPTGARAVFSQNSVSLANSGSGGAILSISTTARPIVTPGASLWTRHFYAVWLAIPGLTVLGLGTQDRRRRRLMGIIALCALSFLLLLLPACSHQTTQIPPSGTPPGTYTITITATSGSDTKSTSVTLIVP